jgi:hypothetical protein
MSLLDTASLIVTPNGYKEGTLYSVIPSDGSGDMSVVRATTATRVNSAGLVELVPYNLFSYSQNLANGAWSTFAVSGTITRTANYANAPDGTLTATRIQNSGGTEVQWTFQSIQLPSNGVISIYAKRTGATNQTFRLMSNNGALLSGTLTATDTWQRFDLAVNSNASALPFGITNDFLGNACDILVWGAQLVEGSTALDYQRTETRLNIPRLDYSNGTCPSLLVEPQRTNLALYSQQFDNGHWVKFNGATVTANTVTSPDGTTNADTLNTASTQEIYASMGAKAIGSITYTFSCFAKYNNATELQIQASDFATSATIGYFNLQTGVATFGQGGTWSGTSAKMENYGNGWYRCILTSTSPVTPALYVSLLTTASGSVYIYGMQTEQASYPTSYIPTTSASVTRNADVVSKTGISSLIGQTEGTLFVDFKLNGSSYSDNTSLYYVTLAKNSPFNFFELIRYNNSLLYFIADNGVGIGPRVLTAFGDLNGRYKFVVSYNSSGLKCFLNGVLIYTSADIIPTCDEVNFGHYDAFVNQQNNFNSVALWKTALTNTQCIQLTTI